MPGFRRNADASGDFKKTGCSNGSSSSGYHPNGSSSGSDGNGINGKRSMTFQLAEIGFSIARKGIWQHVLNFMKYLCRR